MGNCHLMLPRGRKMGLEKAYVAFSDLIHVVRGSVGPPGITEGFFLSVSQALGRYL